MSTIKVNTDEMLSGLDHIERLLSHLKDEVQGLRDELFNDRDLVEVEVDEGISK